MLAGAWIVIGDRAPHRVAQIDLALDEIVPARRVRVLEIGHEDVGAGIQRVDDHLAIGRAGDLDVAIEQIPRQWRHRPIGVTDTARLDGEVGSPAFVELRLYRLAGRQELAPLGPETPLQPGDESEGGGCQDGLVVRLQIAT